MILGKGVAGKMRLGEQAKTGDAACSRKLVPVRFAYLMQRERGGQLCKERAQRLQIGERGAVTTVRLDDPLAAVHGLLLGATALGTEFGSARNGLAAVDAELAGGFASGESSCCGRGR